jgi:hypothetical protein
MFGLNRFTAQYISLAACKPYPITKHITFLLLREYAVHTGTFIGFF